MTQAYFSIRGFPVQVDDVQIATHPQGLRVWPEICEAGCGCILLRERELTGRVKRWNMIVVSDSAMMRHELDVCYDCATTAATFLGVPYIEVMRRALEKTQ